MSTSKALKKSVALDATKGPLLAKMIKFAIPVFLSGVLQQAFNTADAIVIGQFSSAKALGGISATSSLINLLVNFFMGLSVGAAIAISQHVGAGDNDGAKDHAHNALATALMCGIIIAVVGNIFCKPVLRLTQTPEDIIGYSEKYMRIYFAGVPAILLYNYGAAIMRTMGDTKRPLLYLAIGGVANVALNLVFVMGFGMDTDGVAIATITSNIISAIFVMYNLCHSHHACRINLKEIGLRKKEFKRIMGLGLPTGIQSSMFSISNIIMQSTINSMGSTFVIGNAASDNLDKYTAFIGDAFVQSALTFGGQNFGAGNYKRIKKVFMQSMLCVFCSTAILSALLVIFRYQLVGLFIKDNPEAVATGALKVIYVGGMYSIGSMMTVSSANIRAMGKSTVPMIASIFGVCIVRIIWLYTIFPAHKSAEMLFVIYPITWAITLIFNVLTFIYFYKKMASGKMKMGLA
ncbi:MAG: MATE family efflux transporter [Clostridia bacterium]|nr:MATE family efflux transporter [Clostridia bacterium]